MARCGISTCTHNKSCYSIELSFKRVAVKVVEIKFSLLHLKKQSTVRIEQHILVRSYLFLILNIKLVLTFYSLILNFINDCFNCDLYCYSAIYKSNPSKLVQKKIFVTIYSIYDYYWLAIYTCGRDIITFLPL